MFKKILNKKPALIFVSVIILIVIILAIVFWVVTSQYLWSMNSDNNSPKTEFTTDSTTKTDPNDNTSNIADDNDNTDISPDTDTNPSDNGQTASNSTETKTNSSAQNSNSDQSSNNSTNSPTNPSTNQGGNTSTPNTPPSTSYGPWPTPSNTGPRYSSLSSTGNLSSEYSGQIIERQTVEGRLTIRHDNVLVRDVKVNGTGTYMIYVIKKSDDTCPVGVRIEYTEIDGANAPENAIPMYAPHCGYVFDHGYIHNVGRSTRVVNNTTISNSYVYSSRTGDSGAHRGGIGNNGGTNNALINNVVKCTGEGCSAALPMYGDFAPVDGYLIEHNLLSTSAHYCAYGGSLPSKPYQGSNIRFINNHFSTEFSAKCGMSGPIVHFDKNAPGNVFTGNVWHETGEPLTI